MDQEEVYPFHTLPDYLATGLRLVLVGLNPGTYSVQKGHYYARSTNRFWPAFSRSRLSLPIRTALGRDILTPEDDATLLSFGIGFTDVVKRSSGNASELTSTDYQEWAPRLKGRLERYHPAVACFHGVTGYGAFLRCAIGEPKPHPQLGPQPLTLGGPMSAANSVQQPQDQGTTRIFVVPNSSPANAHFTPADQTTWYDRLADFLSTSGAEPRHHDTRPSDA